MLKTYKSNSVYSKGQEIILGGANTLHSTLSPTKLKWHFHTHQLFKVCLQLFSGLSLVLKKEGLWLTKMDTQPERTLRWATHRRQELIHTSCRSESSNISLVVLDKDPIGRNGLSNISSNTEHSYKTLIDRLRAIKSENENLAGTMQGAMLSRSSN